MRIKKIKTTFKKWHISVFLSFLLFSAINESAFSHSDPKKADVCLLEQGKYTLTGTPCDTANQGGKTKFIAAPNSSITMDVVVQMGSDTALEAAGFTLNFTFSGLKSAPTCTPDPDSKFDNPMGTCSPTETALPEYVELADKNPTVKGANFVVAKLIFSTNGLAIGATFSVTDNGINIPGNPGDYIFGVFIPTEVKIEAPATKAPTITVPTPPTSGQEGQPISISGTVADQDSTPYDTKLKITLYYGTTSLTAASQVSPQSSGAFTVSIPGTAVKEKQDVYWGISVEDETGNSAVNPSNFDKTKLSDPAGSNAAKILGANISKGAAPSITITTPPTSGKDGEAISISGTVTDTDSTITALKITLYYGTASLTAASPVSPQSSGAFTVTIPSTSVKTGQDLYWAVTVEDELGLFDKTKSAYPITFDKSSPSLTTAAKIPGGSIIQGYAPTFPTVTQSPIGRIYKGQTVTITGTISDQDTSDKTKIKLTLYYGFGKNFTASRFENSGFGREAGKTTTAYPLSNGNFTFTIPGSDINPTGDNFYWGVAAEDDKNLKSYYPAGWSPTSADPTVGASVVSKNDIIIGTMLGFIPNKEPYPSEFPFRPTPTNKELRVEFEVNDRANVTMRIYSMDGTLIRIVSDPQSGGDTTTPTKLDLNQCKYNFGCSWDGRNYSGFLVANGMYMMNLYITGTGDTFKGQRIDYTKGIVIMK